MATSKRSSARNSETAESENERRSTLEKYGYYIGTTIGCGSFSQVKQAYSIQDDCLVAIKIINKKKARTKTLERFIPREVQAVKSVKHRNIINYLNCIETPSRVYLVMELAKKGSLRELLKTEGRVQEAQARIWFIQLLDAVEYCHNLGWVHRDLKPANILIDEYSNVRLADFGLARPWIRKANGTFDPSRSFCGTCSYASPEILQGLPYDPRHSDIWSLGVVLFAMTYGRLPYDNSSKSELLRQVTKKVVFPEVAFHVNPNITNLLENILVPADLRPKIREIRQSQWISSPYSET